MSSLPVTVTSERALVDRTESLGELGAKGVRKLTVAHQDLKQLPPLDMVVLEPLSMLEDLTIRRFALRNAHAIGELRSLKNLELYRCQVARLEGFERLVSLELLRLHIDDLENVDPLRRLRRLTDARLTSSLFASWPGIKPIQSMHKLVMLELVNSGVPFAANIDIGELTAYLVMLKYLSLVKVGCQSLVFTSVLPNLQSVSLSRNNISLIPDNAFRLLGNLKSLVLTDNMIFSLGFLAEIPQLLWLGISKNMLTRLGPGLAPMTRLKSLVADGNLIHVVDELSTLTSLVHLDICDNFIADLDTLVRLPNLRSLQMRRNPVADMLFLELMPQLDGVNDHDAAFHLRHYAFPADMVV
jgi:Leucine-rich repeat (LRR) protein